MPPLPRYDTVVVGSGFGGVMAAHALVRAGQRVLMLERGDWAQPGDGPADDVWDFFQLRPAYEADAPYRVHHAGGVAEEGVCACVGGASIYYGGVSLRLREGDFSPAPEVVGDSGAEWPFDYAELEPFYTEAERLLDVAGEAGRDPTEPPRSAPYPRAPAPLAPISTRIAGAAERLGLHPFRLPLALDEGCTRCTSCDGYASAGLARLLHEELLPSPNFELRTGTVAVRLGVAGGRVTEVECFDRARGVRETLRPDRVVLAAGALATPHLLLASGLERLGPGGAAVGHYLMRHCNAFVYGFFPRLPEPGRHHKQVGINDYYRVETEAGLRKLGNIQQVMHPQLGGLLRAPARKFGRGTAVRALAGALRPVTHHLSGLQVIAEDQPQRTNRVELEWSSTDAWGLPRLVVRHEYTERDLAARAELVCHAKALLREAGALPWLYEYHVTTFSHVVGTVRMGGDPATSALDEECRFRGLENLFVTDGSVLPTSGGVNPSLTIAANALRVGRLLAR